jgi:Recombination endonuclease VII
MDGIADRRRRQREYQARSQARDPEGFRARRNAANKRWRLNHMEEARAANRAWRAKNPNQYAKKCALDPVGVRAAAAASARRWREKNPERAKAAAARYNARNPKRRCRDTVRRARMTRERVHGSTQRYPAPIGCDCCTKIMADHSRGPQFDHDHTTGFHRGWLCHTCNNGIARLGDTIEGLRRALAYLERAETAWRTSILG